MREEGQVILIDTEHRDPCHASCVRRLVMLTLIQSSELLHFHEYQVISLFQFERQMRPKLSTAHIDLSKSVQGKFCSVSFMARVPPYLQWSLRRSSKPTWFLDEAWNIMLSLTTKRIVEFEVTFLEPIEIMLRCTESAKYILAHGAVYVASCFHCLRPKRSSWSRITRSS